MIDGRAIVAAHGDREMPVWGDRYRVPVEGQSSAWVEQRVRTQIRALANYLKSNSGKVALFGPHDRRIRLGQISDVCLSLAPS